MENHVRMKNERFAEAYTKYRKLVMKMAYDRLRDSFLAEEISQQVFVSFYEHMDEINEEESIKPWLIITTRNVLVDYYRKQQVRKNKTPCLYADAAERVPAAEEEAVERVTNGKLTFQILEDLREKNKEWYEVIMAICVDGMSQREAAEYLRMTPQVLNAKLYRAKQYIRRKYQREYER